MSNSNYIIFIDTETTGLPMKKSRQFGAPYCSPTNFKKYNSARVIELAWIVCEMDTQTECYRKSYLIKPDHYSIDNTEIHGITTEMCHTNGRPIQDVLVEFNTDCLQCGTLSSYNLEFDQNVLLAEMYRYKMDTTTVLSRHFECVLKMSQAAHFPISNNKLITVHHHLCASSACQEHRALGDTILCMQIYFKIKQRHLQSQPERRKRVTETKAESKPDEQKQVAVAVAVATPEPTCNNITDNQANFDNLPEPKTINSPKQQKVVVNIEINGCMYKQKNIKNETFLIHQDRIFKQQSDGELLLVGNVLKLNNRTCYQLISIE